MRKEYLKVSKDTKNFDLDAFERDVWKDAEKEPEELKELKEYALTLTVNQGDAENVNPALFRQALLYANSDLVEFLWGEALEEQREAIKNYSIDNSYNSYIAFWLTWADSNEVNNKDLLPNILKNFHFIMGLYTPEEQANIIEFEDFYFFRGLLGRPVELLKAYWGFTNDDDQRKGMLLSVTGKGIDSFAYNISDTDPSSAEGALFVLQKVIEFEDEEVTQAYIEAIQKLSYKPFSGSPVEEGIELIKCLIAANIDAPIKDKMMALVIQALSENIDAHYEHMDLFGEILQDEVYASAGALNNQILDEVRLFEFKNFIANSDPSKLDDNFHEKIAYALQPTIIDPDKYYLDILFQDEDFNTLNFVFENLYRPATISVEIVDQFKPLAQKYLNQMTFGTSGDDAVLDSDELFISLINVAELDKNELENVFKGLADALIKQYREDLQTWTHFPVIAKLHKGNRGLFAEYLSKNHLDFTKELVFYLKGRPKTESVNYLFKSLEAELSPEEFSDTTDAVDTVELDSQVSGSGDDESHSQSDSETHDEGEPSETEDKEGRYFSRKNWTDNKKAITDNIFGETKIDPAFTKALDHLARHARLHLDTERKSPRATARQEKYTALETLFNRFANEVNGEEVEDRFDALQGLLEGVLDKNPADSDLLKNRKSFSGAYEKMGQLLGKFSFLHYRYEHGENSHTAVSTTDHYLMELYDAVKPQAILEI